MAPPFAIFYQQTTPSFVPAMRLIGAITNSQVATVTTTISHGYQTGCIVRIYNRYANVFGMGQIDRLEGPITVTGDDTFTITIDTTDFDPFTYVAEPSILVSSGPMVVPIGEINSTLNCAVKNNK